MPNVAEYEDAALRISEILAALPTDEEREECLALVHTFYCYHCGRRQPEHGRPCQCWNDE